MSQVSIDPSVMEEDKELLEDLLAAAVNDALYVKMKQTLKLRMEEATAGLNLPPGFEDAVLVMHFLLLLNN